MASKVPTSSMATSRADSCGKKPGYRQLMRTPGAWAFVLPGFAARQPFAMLTIGMVLLVRHVTGSYGTAGAAAAVTGAAMALCAPSAGRLADRRGQRAVLLPGVVLHAASVACVVALCLAHAPSWALLIAAVPTGATAPQIGPMVRARWAAALGSESPLITTAAAFESVTDELTFVVGPVLATALCTGVHPAAGLVAEAALTVIGGLVFAAQGRRAPAGQELSPGAVKTGSSALAVPGVRPLVVAFLGVGAVFGGMQVSVAAYTQEAGHPGLNGVVYGTFAAGNMLSGVVYGLVAWRHGPRARLLAAYAGLTLACVPLWAVDGLVPMALTVLAAGVFVAPTIVTGYALVNTLVPGRSRTEAYTWMTGAVAFGQAVAVTVAGLLTDAAGSSAGFLVPLAGTAVALAVLVGLRGRLVPRAGGVVAAGVIGHRQPVPVD